MVKGYESKKDEKTNKLLNEIAQKQKELREVKAELAALYTDCREHLDIPPGQNMEIDAVDVEASVTFTTKVSFIDEKISRIMGCGNEEVKKSFKKYFDASLTYKCSNLKGLKKAMSMNPDLDKAVKWCSETKISDAQIKATALTYDKDE